MTNPKQKPVQHKRILLRSATTGPRSVAAASLSNGVLPSTLLLPPAVIALLRRLQGFFAASGVSAYLVGGAARDGLLGRPTADLDVAVAGGEIGALARALGVFLPGTVVPLDEERRIYRVVAIHSASSDQGYLSIDLAALHGETVEADAMTRDFTIDALAVPFATLDLDDGAAGILDAAGGLGDLWSRRVRAIADNVFVDDPLRLLRAVRLKAELGFEIDPHTLDLIRRDAHLLDSVSPERVRDEFCRILDAPGAGAHIRLLDTLGLLTRVVPELEEARGVGQPKEHYWDVLQHSFEAVGAAEHVLREAAHTPANGSYSWDAAVIDRTPWDVELSAYFSEPVSGSRTRATLVKLAALLHDVAKPATRTIEEGGRMRFIGHPALGASMTERITSRLRFSTRETRMLCTMVDEHLRPGLITRGEQPPSRRAVHRFFRDAGEVVVDVLFLSFADYMAARGPLLEDDDWRRYSGNLAKLLEAWRGGKSIPQPVKLIDGHDIMSEFALPPGPTLRPLLEAVAESQAIGEIGTREEALALVTRLLDEQRASQGA